MRLIDADALRNEYCKDCSVDCRYSCKYDPLCGTMMWVNEAYTIDAVPVTRCKDCKHYQYVEGGKPLCEWHRIACAYDDFCSYGERRSDA